MLIGSAVTVAMGLAFSAGAALRHSGPQTKPLQPTLRGAQVAETEHTSLPASLGVGETQGNASIFETVYGVVKENYVDKLPSDTKLAHGAVRAMIASLEDPNSYVVEPEQRQLLEAEAAGKLGGIGAALTVVGKKQEGYTDYKLTVVSALPDSPAEKAGLKSGDTVVRIDGRWVMGYNPIIAYNRVLDRWQDHDATDEEVEKARLATREKITAGVSYHDAELLLRGVKSGFKAVGAKAIAAKTSYKVTVERAGQPVTVEVTPATTEVATASGRTLSGGAGYLKIPYFADKTADAVRAALAGLPAGGLVLDLRGNPGGSLESGQAVVGLLAGAGAFGVEQGPRGKKNPLVSKGDALRKGPLTVLIDHGTASVAEAVAACLSERAGATLVGQKTFGDAGVQALYTLDDGSGFTLTVGSLTSPRETRWAGVGLTPKIALAPGTPEDQILARAVAALSASPSVTAKVPAAGK